MITFYAFVLKLFRRLNILDPEGQKGFLSMIISFIIVEHNTFLEKIPSIKMKRLFDID